MDGVSPLCLRLVWPEKPQNLLPRAKWTCVSCVLTGHHPARIRLWAWLLVWKPEARIFSIPGSSAYPKQQREALCWESPVSGPVGTQRSPEELPGSLMHTFFTWVLCKDLFPWGKERGRRDKGGTQGKKENWQFRVGVKTGSKFKHTH